MIRIRLLAVAVSITIGIAHASNLWPIYEQACLSNGIPEDQCLCILDTVVENHGEAPARYVGLDMILRYDEAAEILEQIGEDKAFAASDTFDVAQNMDCSSGRLARLRGTYQGSGLADAASTSVSADAVGGTATSGGQFTIMDAFASAVPVFDLRHADREVVADVTGKITDQVLFANPNANVRDYIGFYEIVDFEGGIDPNGDGKADLRPGDADYAAEVQKRMLPTKLYFQKNSGNNQVLGEVRFRNKLYAPVVRIQGAPGASGMQRNMNLTNVEDLMRAMRAPQHLYFVFPQANPDGANNLAKRDNNSIGFESSPDGGQSHADAIFEFRVGM